MKSTLLLCMLAASSVLGFEMTNPQLPQKTSNRMRWMRSTATTRSQVRCVNNQQCESMDVPDPIWKFRTNAIQSFQPTQNFVLIGFDQDDEDSTNENHATRAEVGWDRFTGIVVATGPGVQSQALTEGSRVYFSSACVAKWTVAGWTAMYGPQKAVAMSGRLMNGVSINNGDSWGYPGTPSIRTWENALESNPSKGTEEATTQSSMVYEDEFWYPGRSGAGWWPTHTANQDTFRQDTPMDNPGQQSNYLLCPESQVFGVLNEEGFAAHDTHHYIKASIAFEQSKQQWFTADSSKYDGGVSYNNMDSRKISGGFGTLGNYNPTTF